MTKRIVSGVFLLIALGALGLILAGALTSGEQLIVRFLTAVIVAALALYVISDLRLQADDAVATTGARATSPANRSSTRGAPPANSTAAFMATVTGRKTSSTASPSSASASASAWIVDEGFDDDPAVLDQRSSTAESDRPATVTGGAEIEIDAVEQAIRPSLAAVRDGDDAPMSPYDDFDTGVTPMWPLTPDGQVVSGSDESDTAEVDGLVAIFAKRSEQEQLLLQEPMAVNGHHHFTGPIGLLDTTERPPARISHFPTMNPTATPTMGDDGGGVHLEGSAPEPAGSGGGKDDHPDGGSEPAADGDEAALDVLSGPEALQAEAEFEHEGDLEAGAEGDLEAGAEVVDTGERAAPVVTPPSTRNRPARVHDHTSAAIAPIIDLRFDTINEQLGLDIDTAIRSGEFGVITSLMDQGVLSSDGPLSDQDIRTMVYVAFTSTELRKILLAGGVPDGANPLDLGEIEIFRRHLTAAGLGAGETIDLRLDDESAQSAEGATGADAGAQV